MLSSTTGILSETTGLLLQRTGTLWMMKDQKASPAPLSAWKRRYKHPIPTKLSSNTVTPRIRSPSRTNPISLRPWSAMHPLSSRPYMKARKTHPFPTLYSPKRSPRYLHNPTLTTSRHHIPGVLWLCLRLLLTLEDGCVTSFQARY